MLSSGRAEREGEKKGSSALLALILSIFLQPLSVFSRHAGVRSVLKSPGGFLLSSSCCQRCQAALNPPAATFERSQFQSQLHPPLSQDKSTSSCIAISQLWQPPIVSVHILSVKKLSLLGREAFVMSQRVPSSTGWVAPPFTPARCYPEYWTRCFSGVFAILLSPPKIRKVKKRKRKKEKKNSFCLF